MFHLLFENPCARFKIVKSLEITNSVTGQGSMLHMEDLPKPFHQLEEKLSREDSFIENISIFPLKIISVSSFFQKGPARSGSVTSSQW